MLRSPEQRIDKLLVLILNEVRVSSFGYANAESTVPRTCSMHSV